MVQVLGLLGNPVADLGLDTPKGGIVPPTPKMLIRGERERQRQREKEGESL